MAQAEKAFAQAGEIAPEEPKYPYNRGLALLHLGKEEEADKAFREAMRRKPDDADAQRALSQLRERRASWWEWWFSIPPASSGRRRVGIVLIVALTALVVLPLGYLAIPFIYGEPYEEPLPWQYYLAALAVPLALLVLPTVRRLKVGEVELEPRLPPAESIESLAPRL